MPAPENASLNPQAPELNHQGWIRELPRKLAHIQSLWQKLVYVKWDLQALGLMHRLAQEILTAAQARDLTDIVPIVLNLQRLLETLQSRHIPPPEAERGRVNGMLQRLAKGILALHATDFYSTPSQRDAATPAERVHDDATAARRVYLLEEDAHQAELLALRLGHHGYAVRRFATAGELHQAVQRRVPDLVLAEVTLDQGALAGVEAIDALRSELAVDLPVLFLSARGDLAARLAAVRAGGLGYFLKPLEYDDLLRRVDELLQRQVIAYKVLIVEDEEQLASAYSLVLQQAGLITRVLPRPLQVLQVLHDFQPDLILMDLYLPECTGIELMQLIRQDSTNCTLPIVFLSSDSDPAKHNAALSQGADAFLLKPIKPDQLIDAVSSRVGRARALRQRMHFLGQQDPLTGLLNQRAFLGHLDRHMAEFRGGKVEAALLYMEVDQCRSLRDKLGISIADLLLADLASRIRERLVRASRLAHLSDGSFCALVLDVDAAQARDLAVMLCDRIAAGVFSAEQESVAMTLSIGVSVLTQDQVLAHDWLSSAAFACDVARDAGGNRVELHRAAAVDLATRAQHARCAALVRQALAGEGFYCVYQPIANLRGKPVERYDVLLRARDAEGREVAADRIFQVAREERLITAIDRWVILHLIDVLQGRADAGTNTVFFIRLSAESLNDPAFSGWIEDTLATTMVNARQLIFEFAEADVATSVRVAGNLFEHLKRLGCHIALEHFGTSLSSAQLLSHLPIDYVKIDSSFVHDLVHRPANRESIQGILRQAESAGAMVIAGFVEDAGSLAVLWQCGVQFIQGNFLREPDASLNFDFNDELNG